MGFIDEIKARAKQDIKTIVLPETEDEIGRASCRERVYVLV